MSAKLMGRVYELELNHSQQSIALALADHAHDDGTRIFPGIEYTAWKTGYSERNVIRIMGDLESIGLLERVGGQGTGRGNVQEYFMDVAAVPMKAPFQRGNAAPKRAKKGGNSSSNTKGDNLSKGDNSAVKGDKPHTQRVTSQAAKGDKSDTAHIEDCVRALTINKPLGEPSVQPPAFVCERNPFADFEASLNAPSPQTAPPRSGRTPAAKAAVKVEEDAETINAIWLAYPRREGKTPALKAIETALTNLRTGKDVPDGEFDKRRYAEWLMERTQRYAAIRREGDPQFTPHAATWFNQARYCDDEEEWIAASKRQKSAKENYGTNWTNNNPRPPARVEYDEQRIGDHLRRRGILPAARGNG